MTDHEQAPQEQKPDGRHFDPGRYLTKVGSADYLEVKWRLVWLRETHPDASIETQLVSHADQVAIFKATISIPGGGSASGYGSESYDDFREYIEKAETKAIGRALAALGYGTQFCPDFDFGAADGNVVDSPIDFASTRGRRMSPGGSGGGGYNQPRQGGGNFRGGQGGGGASQPATPRQIKFIQAIAREHGMTDTMLNDEVQELYGKAVEQLDRRDASAYIERLQGRRNVTEFHN